MGRRSTWFCGLVIVLLASAQPALAAGIQCQFARGEIEHAICTNTGLHALDSELASVYAALLERDPAQAKAVRRDERDWLGERDLVGMLPSAGNGPANVRALQRAYVQRIAFLRSVDDPDTIFESPVTRVLITAAYALPSGTTNVLSALQARDVVHLAPIHAHTGLASTLAALPAPPDASLQQALQQLAAKYDGTRPYFDQTSLTLAYMPDAGIGGIYRVAGTAACTQWVLFRKQGNSTVLAVTPRVTQATGCGNMQDLASIDGYPLLITEHDGIRTPYADLEWQRSGERGWGVVVRVHIRFTGNLALASRATCRLAGTACAAIPNTALDAASRYLSDVHTLLQPAWLSAPSTATYATLERVAEQNQTPACDGALWFPAQAGGQLLAGLIQQQCIGTHDQRGLRVDFWAQKHGKLVRVARDTVAERNGRVLLAARMPLRPEAADPWRAAAAGGQ